MKILVDEMPRSQEECIRATKIWDFIVEDLYSLCELDKKTCYDVNECRHYTTLPR